MESREGLRKVSDGVTGDIFMPAMASREEDESVSRLPRRVLSARTGGAGGESSDTAVRSRAVRGRDMCRGGFIDNVG